MKCIGAGETKLCDIYACRLHRDAIPIQSKTSMSPDADAHKLSNSLFALFVTFFLAFKILKVHSQFERNKIEFSN